MKKLNPIKCLLGLLVLLAFFPCRVNAQDEEEEEQLPLLLDVRYFNKNNTLPYVVVIAKTKIDRRFHPVADLPLTIYLNEVNDSNLVGTCTTDQKGFAQTYLPPELAGEWSSGPAHNFIAVAESGEKYEDAEEGVEMVKGKLTLDTLTEDSVRYFIVNLTYLDSGQWKPEAEADIRIGIARLGGFLPVGEDEIYFTDESGEVKAKFTLAGLPGDQNGNFKVVAKTDDYYPLGNLITEMQVDWGEPLVKDNEYALRSLSGTSDKAPFWLLILANFIIVLVWGVLIYLVFQLLKVRRIGRSMA